MTLTSIAPLTTRVIEKRLSADEAGPNLIDYATACASFTWAKARSELSGLRGGTGLNIAYEAVDRHAAGPRARHLALRWIGRNDERRDFTYGDLARATNRFANVLRSLAVAKGDRVFILADRIPELYIAVLGALKNGSVVCPLFSAFGPEPIRMRMQIGHGAVLVTTLSLYERKVAPIREALPELRHVLLAGVAPGSMLPSGTSDLSSWPG